MRTLHRHTPFAVVMVLCCSVWNGKVAVWQAGVFAVQLLTVSVLGAIAIAKAASQSASKMNRFTRLHSNTTTIGGNSCLKKLMKF
jgi:hypothetical protein